MKISPVRAKVFHADGRRERNDKINPLYAELNAICHFLTV